MRLWRFKTPFLQRSLMNLMSNLPICFSEKSKYYDKINNKVIGKFKDEACRVPITEFVGLRSKMYSYIKGKDKGGKTAKGIKKLLLNKDIKHEDYKNVLFDSKQIRHKLKTVRSNNHQLGS